MNFIDTQELNKSKVSAMLGRQIDTIATLDHVYASPPLRLIDSHHRLMKYDNLLLLLWDFNLPDIVKYRQELVLDSCLFSSKREDFYAYPCDQLYASSEVLSPNTTMQIELLDEVIAKYFIRDNCNILSDRFREIVELFHQTNKSQKSSDFYIDYLSSLYSFLGFKDISQFVTESMRSFFHSGLLFGYLPDLISSTRDEKYGLGLLLEKSEIFKKPYFRYLNGKEYDLTDIQSAECDLRSKQILPSKQIIFWMFALAGIQHFGNDYGFFASFEDYMEQLGIESNVGRLQLTGHKQDGMDFIQFDSIRSYTIVPSRSSSPKFQPLNTKLSRLQNIISAYLHLGKEGLYQSWSKYSSHGEVTNIPMGNVSFS